MTPGERPRFQILFGRIRWFLADQRADEIAAYVANWQGERSLHVVDLFGNSQRILCLGACCGLGQAECRLYSPGWRKEDKNGIGRIRMD